MEEKNFENIMKTYLKELEIDLTKLQINQFYKYMNLLISWNKVMNLTAIVEPQEIILKHFVDSLTILNKVNENDKIIDVGTGAGFPGIPIKIVYPKTQVILLDSLNKRIKFLDEVINELQLKNIKALHGRAEDFGKVFEHREKYDCVVARAVAPLNVLAEYLMPFAKLGEKVIAMKAGNCEEEINQSKNAIKKLGGKIINIEEFLLPESNIERTIIEIKKEESTKNIYPRKAGTPSKHPL